MSSSIGPRGELFIRLKDQFERAAQEGAEAVERAVVAALATPLQSNTPEALLTLIEQMRDVASDWPLTAEGSVFDPARNFLTQLPAITVTTNPETVRAPAQQWYAQHAPHLTGE
jgi:hypothetical protein